MISVERQLLTRSSSRSASPGLPPSPPVQFPGRSAQHVRVTIHACHMKSALTKVLTRASRCWNWRAGAAIRSLLSLPGPLNREARTDDLRTPGSILPQLHASRACDQRRSRLHRPYLGLMQHDPVALLPRRLPGRVRGGEARLPDRQRPLAACRRTTSPPQPRAAYEHCLPKGQAHACTALRSVRPQPCCSGAPPPAQGGPRMHSGTPTAGAARTLRGAGRFGGARAQRRGRHEQRSGGRVGGASAVQRRSDRLCVRVVALLQLHQRHFQHLVHLQNDTPRDCQIRLQPTGAAPSHCREGAR